jgi:uncharacterized membrane protein YgaE (UPF0421/DUF939 family)
LKVNVFLTEIILSIFISDAIEVYVDTKIRNLDLDSNTEYDIKGRLKDCINWINEQLTDMDEDIDTFIEQMNEPSDREVWNKEYERQREVEFI